MSRRITFPLLGLLLLIAVVKAQNTCYVSHNGVDSATCGNKTTDACATIQQCIDNNPFDWGNLTLNGTSVDMMIFPGTYSGDGFCDLEFVGFVSLTNYNNGSVTIDCEGQSRHFVLQATDDFSVSSISITGINFVNGSADNGGSLYIQAHSGFTVTITNCTFSSNSATNSGGAIYSEIADVSTQVQITNCQFNNNNAQSGGATYVTSFCFMTNCTFTNNKATYGGGSYVVGGADMQRTFWYDNTAVDGGAVFIDSTNTAFSQYLERSVFKYNYAQNMGGAIYLQSSQDNDNNNAYDFNGLTIVNNNASKGGAFAIGAKSLVNYYFQYSNISFNYADRGGAGYIYSKYSYSAKYMYQWFSAQLQYNQARIEGGGLYIDFTNDTNMNSFDLQGPVLSKNKPDNIQCSNSSAAFCNSCQAQDCGYCPSTCVVASGGALPACFSPQNQLDCVNGMCFYGTAQNGAFCECVVGWSGAACDQKEGNKKNNGKEWIYAVVSSVGAVAVAAIVVGAVMYIRRRKRHQYSPIH